MKKLLSIGLVAVMFVFASCSNDETTPINEINQSVMHAKGEGSGVDPNLNTEILVLANQLVDELQHNQNPPESYRLRCHKYTSWGGRGIYEWNGRYIYFAWNKDGLYDLWDMGSNQDIDSLCRINQQ